MPYSWFILKYVSHIPKYIIYSVCRHRAENNKMIPENDIQTRVRSESPWTGMGCDLG